MRRLLIPTSGWPTTTIAPGVALVVDPALIGSGTDAGPLAEHIAKLLNGRCSTPLSARLVTIST
jgi:hypothetical protein